MSKEREIVKQYGMLYSSELGIDLESGKEGEIFKWFLASLLFGKRISEEIAKRTYKEFEKAKLLTPQAITKAGWDRLVEILDKGGYVRYDFSTADKLLEICNLLMKRYGSLEKMHEEAKNARDLELRLQEFRGIGPITTNIFLRELRHVWEKADPQISELAKIAARKLKIDISKFDRKTKSFVMLEAALTRIGKLMKKGKLSNIKKA